MRLIVLGVVALATPASAMAQIKFFGPGRLDRQDEQVQTLPQPGPGFRRDTPPLARPAPPKLPTDEDSKLAPRRGAEKAPPGELCLLSVERCPQDAEVYAEPYREGAAKAYALN